MNPIIYIVPIVFIVLISIVGFAAGKKKLSAHGAGTLVQKEQEGQNPSQDEHAGKDRVYQIKQGQQSTHALGPVQKVIRGRIRFIPLGLFFIALSAYSIYSLYFTSTISFVPKEPLYMLASTAILAMGVFWGLQQLYFASCKIKLRRTGLELCSIFGKKAYKYKDLDIRIYQGIEHRSESGGYSNSVMKTSVFNFIWVCQILIKSQQKLIQLKSSRYAWLKSKITSLQEGLVWE